MHSSDYATVMCFLYYRYWWGDGAKYEKATLWQCLEEVV